MILDWRRPSPEYVICVGLQSVHGRITVVMPAVSQRSGQLYTTLQWVHGRITVVMSRAFKVFIPGPTASMGKTEGVRYCIN
jgi:hypothetical protein